MCLLPGERTTPLMEKLNAKLSRNGAEESTIMSEHQMRRATDCSDDCDDGGISVKLMKCAACKKKTVYCSVVCQKAHAKAGRNVICKQTIAARANLKAQSATSAMAKMILTVSDDAQKWCDTMTPVFLHIAPSALDLFSDFSRIHRYAVDVLCKHLPSAKGLGRFEIVSAVPVLIANLKVQRRLTDKVLKELQRSDKESYPAVFFSQLWWSGFRGVRRLLTTRHEEVDV